MCFPLPSIFFWAVVSLLITKPPFKCSGFLEVTSPQPTSYSLFLSWDHLRFRLASCFLATFSCCCKSLRCPTSMPGNMARKRRNFVGCTGCSIVFVVFVGGYPWIHGSSCVFVCVCDNIQQGSLSVNTVTLPFSESWGCEIHNYQKKTYGPNNFQSEILIVDRLSFWYYEFPKDGKFKFSNCGDSDMCMSIYVCVCV